MKDDQTIAIAWFSPPFETLSVSEVHPEGQEILKIPFDYLQPRNVLSVSKGQFSFSILLYKQNVNVMKSQLLEGTCCQRSCWLF